MSKQYFSVIAKESKSDKWSIQFGDYDRTVAQDEADDMKESGEWAMVKVIKTAPQQAAIESAVAALNA